VAAFPWKAGGMDVLGCTFEFEHSPTRWESVKIENDSKTKENDFSKY